MMMIEKKYMQIRESTLVREKEKHQKNEKKK